MLAAILERNTRLISINTNPFHTDSLGVLDYPGPMTTTPNPDGSPTDTPLADCTQPTESYIRPSAADDLYRHVNGEWLDTHQIPSDRSSDGAFMALRYLSEERMLEIIEDAPEDSLVGTLYRSFMDEERLEKLGCEPLEPDLDILRAVTTHHQLALATAELGRIGISGALGAWVDQDATSPNEYRLFLAQSGLSLPDEAYYREERHAETLAALQDHIERMLSLSGVLTTVPLVAEMTPAEAAKEIVEWETTLAGFHVDAARNRIIEDRYNPYTIEELGHKEAFAGWPVAEWLACLSRTDAHPEGAIGGADTLDDTIIVRQPSYLEGLSSVWSRTPLTTLVAWMVWNVLQGRARFLTAELCAANFDFVGRRLNGTTEQLSRDKRGVALVDSFLGELIGQEYVARYFPPSHKAYIRGLVDNLLEAYRVSIRTLEWMTPETRERALQKLDAFTVKVGYPEQCRDYSGLTLSAENLLDSLRTLTVFHGNHEWDKLGRPVDREEWFMHPQTVNAYFNPSMNEIVFPAAILQPPFFDSEADDATNYGGIGAVIGHEIGHGFDDQGSKYDGQGRLHNWWTDEDRQAFSKRTQGLVDQYNALTPQGLDPEVHHVNGELTLGENIGDLGGLAIALLAYELALAEQGIPSPQEAPLKDGLTGLQRVFYSWATVWRSLTRPERAITLLSIDPHSPAEFRCNQIVRNLPQFYEAFNVTPQDALWLPEEERVSIWR